MEFEYQLNEPALHALFMKAHAAVTDTSQGPMRDGFDQASAVYLGFLRRRFVQQSKGGGEWPDLALSTKVARMRGTKAGRRKYDKVKSSIPRKFRTRDRTVGTAQLSGAKFDILRDMGLLLNSLTTGAPGNINQPLPDGVRVGTAIKHARYHQDGGRNLPQRKIFVDPDPPTHQLIVVCLKTGAIKAMQEAAK